MDLVLQLRALCLLANLIELPLVHELALDGLLALDLLPQAI